MRSALLPSLSICLRAGDAAGAPVAELAATAHSCCQLLSHVCPPVCSWPKALALLDRQIDMGIAIDALAISCKAALCQCVIYLATERYEEAVKKENDLRAGKIESWLQSSERKYFRSTMQGYVHHQATR